VQYRVGGGFLFQLDSPGPQLPTFQIHSIRNAEALEIYP
jgi:hypothetical protein